MKVKINSSEFLVGLGLMLVIAGTVMLGASLGIVTLK
jgi:hypothetical protein